MRAHHRLPGAEHPGKARIVSGARNALGRDFTSVQGLLVARTSAPVQPILAALRAWAFDQAWIYCRFWSGSGRYVL